MTAVPVSNLLHTKWYLWGRTREFLVLFFPEFHFTNTLHILTSLFPFQLIYVFSIHSTFISFIIRKNRWIDHHCLKIWLLRLIGVVYCLSDLWVWVQIRGSGEVTRILATQGPAYIGNTNFAIIVMDSNNNYYYHHQHHQQQEVTKSPVYRLAIISSIPIDSILIHQSYFNNLLSMEPKKL